MSPTSVYTTGRQHRFMRGNNHQILNVAFAIVTENLFHLAGPAIHCTDIMQSLAHPKEMVASEWIAKGIYYGCAFLTARLPDVDLHLQFLGRHRGFTHSLLGGALFATFLSVTGFLSIMFLQTHGVVLSQAQEALGLLAMISSTLGYFYHVLADSLTVAGVSFLWPSSICLRLLPQRYRIRTGRRSEYVAVSAMILTVGLLVVSNIAGI